MGNTMEIFLPRFGVTRMAQKDENDILVEYSKNKLMFQLWTCDTSYKPIFSRGIQWRYFCLDLASPGWPRRTRKTSWLSTARTNLCFNYGHVIHLISLFFCGKYDGDIFTLIWRHQNVLERREGHPG